MATQQEKGQRFKALHEAPGSFVIPNPWDGASAKILAHLGFRALATSSGAQAGTLGRKDGHVSREEAIRHVEVIVNATDLPVSADLERGFGDRPEDAAETVRQAAAIGLVGCSIEDSLAPGKPGVFEFDAAVARVAAAADAAKRLPFPFMLSARTENFLRGNPDLDDTIKRLKAFEAAGADVLFAPGLPALDAVRAVCQSVSKPVNFMVGIPKRSFSVAELTDAGVKRISLATSLYRAAMTGLLAAAREVAEHGTFGYVETNLPGLDLNSLLEG